MNNIKVAISQDFLISFAKLPRTIQGKVTEFVNKFRNNPLAPGINYEKLTNGADKKIYSVRIDETYRGIVVRQAESGVYLLLWVDHHDEAYEWAKRKRCDLNPQTGTIQVYDVKEKSNELEKIENTKENNQQSIFSNINDTELIKLGVPEIQISFIRSITSSEQFYNSKTSIPLDAYENLSWLVEGFPIKEVLDLVKDEIEEQKPESLSDALNNYATQRSFVIVEGEEELRTMMAAPLEQWRVFLHPTQRKIVHKHYNGSARVLGGAGTGKTVVAMHRAKWLASKLPQDKKVLFTTFTANLAADISDNLKKICTSDEIKKIDVINLDAWVNQYMKSVGYNAEIIYDSERLSSIWENAILNADNALDFSPSFYEEEWNRVAVAQEAFSLQDYVKANRIGRGTRLDRKKRILVWKVFECYINILKEEHIRDINFAMSDCINLLKTDINKQNYENIIIDEGQDFSNNAYSLIRAISGEPHPNDIFIVGDAHQRIYKNHSVLSKCGINIRGRSNKLKINYRTTEEIRKYAFALLDGISFDDLDEEIDSNDQCQSLTHGTNPCIKNFDNASQEFEFILSEIQQLTKIGIELKNICIVARTKKLVDDYTSLLTQKGLRTYAIKRNKTDNRNQNGIRVATMHRIKGLEFQYVFIVAANNKIIPLVSAINHTDEISKKESITAEKCLLYVSLTRAQKGAYITSYGKQTPFIK